jgi:hypothetical protein
MLCRRQGEIMNQPLHLAVQKAAARARRAQLLAGLLSIASVSCGSSPETSNGGLLLLSGVKKRAEPKPAAKRPNQRPYTPPKVPLGLNLSGVNYFTTAIPFLDGMKMSDPFQSTNIPGAENKWNTELADKIPRDAEGYPLEAPYLVPGNPTPQILRASVISAVYGGRYVVLYEGDGELDFPASPLQVVNRGPGRIELDVQASKDRSIFVAIVRSNKLNHVRNIRMILPGFEPVYATQIFHPTYLARLRGVGAVRFMDWGNTNNTPVEKWSERTTPGMFQGTSKGVALEYQIELANRLDADAWFCVPHLADDEYVQQMAKLIKQRLDPKHKAYIEYSNELWNGIFKQTQWAGEKGCSVGLNKLGRYSGSCREDGPRYWAGIKWQARRSGQIFQIFDKVFAADSGRLVRVIAGQATNDHLNEVLLESVESSAINPAGLQAEVLAVAPYAGHGVATDLVDEGKVASIGVSEILDRLERTVGPHVRQSTAANKKLVDAHGMHLVAYEGGQHLVAYGGAENNQQLVDKLIAANRDPRMRGIYVKMLDAWYEESDQGLMMLFNYMESPNKFGVWGLLESQEQPVERAPKYQAFFDRLQRLGLRARAQERPTPPPSPPPATTPPGAPAVQQPAPATTPSPIAPPARP